MSDGIARFKDFTENKEKIQFKVRGETFVALDDILLSQLGKLSALGNDIGDDDGESAAEKILTVFEALLTKESYERFRAAVNGEGETVIGIMLIKRIIPWLLEQYGLRPTRPSSGSVNTSSENGGNSTDGAQQEDWTAHE